MNKADLARSAISSSTSAKVGERMDARLAGPCHGGYTDPFKAQVTPEAMLPLRYLDLLETMVIVLNPAGEVTLANRFACRILGTTEADILGQNWFKHYVPAEQRQAEWELFAAIISGKAEPIHYLEQQVCTERGEILLIGWHNSLLCDEESNISGWLAIGNDITQQRQAEKALRRSEAQFRALFENVPVGIYRISLDGKILAANPALARMLGYATAEDVLKLRADDIYVQTEQYRHLLQATKKYGEVRNFEVQLRRKSGREVIALANVRQVKGEDGRIIYYEGSLTDITQMKRTEAALRESERKYRSLFDNAGVGIYRATADGRLLAANPALVQMLEYENEADLLQVNMTDLFASREEGEKVYQLLAQNGEIKSIESTLKCKDGQIITVRTTVCNTYDEQDDLLCYEGTVINITQQKQAEQVQMRLLNILDASQNEIYVFDPQTLHFHYVNQGALRNLGYTPEQIQALTPLDLKPEFNETTFRQLLAPLLSGKKSTLVFRTQHRRANGSQYPVEVHLQLVEYGGERFFLAVVLDITERKKMEENLRRRVTALEALYQSGVHLSALSEPRQIAHKVIAVLQDKLSWHHIAIREYDPQTDRLQVLALCIEGFSEAETRQEEERLNALVTTPAHGLSGWVIQHGQVVRLVEVQNDPRYIETYPGIHSGLYVPLKNGERIIGSIAVESKQPHAFDESDEQFLVTIAAQIAAGIENARLFQAIKKQAREFAALYETARAVASYHDQEGVLRTIIEHTTQLLNVPICGIYLYEEASNELVMAMNVGLPEKLGLRLKMGEGLAGKIAESRKPMIIEDYHTWEGRSPQYEDISLHAVLGVPMIYNGELMGVLAVAETNTSPRKFNKNDAQLLSLFANIAASAIYSTRLIHQLEQQIQRLSALHEMDTTIAATTSLQISLRVALEHVLRLLEVDAACVLTFNPTTLTLTYMSGAGFRNPQNRRSQLRPGEGVAGKAVLQQKMIQSNDPREFAREFLDPNFIKNEGFQSCLAVPLVPKGKVSGVLEVYLRKPFSSESEWENLLQILAGQIALAIDHAQLLEKLEQANTELIMAYDATIEGWSRALDLRDHETEGHTQRVTELTMRLARAMNIPDHQLVHIYRGAILHDIGKIGVPDNILHKAGPLTDEEWKIMRQHPQLAYELMSPIIYLRPAIDIPYCHHEKWDGSGYPRGLKGEEIPLVARLFAVADVFDALTSDRPYRQAWSVEQALKYIAEQAGKHFDPKVVSVFLELMKGQSTTSTTTSPGSAPMGDIIRPWR